MLRVGQRVSSLSIKSTENGLWALGRSNIRPASSFPALPRSGVNWKFALPFGAAIGGTWYYFLLHVTNDERWSASVVKQVFKNIRDNQDVAASLGRGIVPENAWWLPGERPWVTGKVEMPRGVVDVSFRIHGESGAGTVYFTSVRKQKGADFTNLRYKFIGDDGTEIDLLPTLQ